MAKEKTKYPGVYKQNRISKKTKKDDTFFYIWYRANGKAHHELVGSVATGMSAAKANQARIAKMTGRELPNTEKRKAEKKAREAKNNIWSINRLWEDYKADKPKLKGIATDENRFKNHLASEFGDKESSDIDPLSIRRLRKQLEKKLKPQTVKHVLALLKRIINHGVKFGYCVSLGFKIDMPTVDNIKTEDLSETQMQRLMEAIEADENTQAKNFLKLILCTGVRRSELFRLQWDDIEFERGFIFLRTPKGEKSQRIPLNKSAKELLLNHEKPFPESPYVFPGRDGKQRVEIRKPTNRIKERAGLPKDFRINHGLRHVYGSMMASSGKVDMYHLQKLLTHKSPLMTQRYAHLRDEALKNASEVASDIIDNIVTKEEKKVINMKP